MGSLCPVLRGRAGPAFVRGAEGSRNSTVFPRDSRYPSEGRRKPFRCPPLLARGGPELRRAVSVTQSVSQRRKSPGPSRAWDWTVRSNCLPAADSKKDSAVFLVRSSMVLR